nr:hypothetical protein [Tanacetum cinerariifolium]
MANLSHSGSDALTEVHNTYNVNNNMFNQGVQVIPSSEQSNVVNHSETEITSDSNIIPYSQYVIESQQAAVQNSNLSTQQDALILSVIEQLKTQVVNYTKINLENKSINDTLTAELERYKEQVQVLKEGQIVEAVEQHRLESKTFEIKMNQVLNENERLLEQVINKDIVNVVVNSTMDNASVNMNECEKTAHSGYLRHTQEQTAILREVVEQGKSQNLLNNSSDHAYTPKHVVTLVYSRIPKKSKTTDPVSKSKVIKFVSANKKEPSKSWGSIVSNVPSSSLDEC